MNLNNQTLEKWLVKPPKKKYKHSKRIDYFSRYQSLKQYLKKNVHKNVILGANLKEPEILLNDHGEDHIDTVIERASELVGSPLCDLNALEVYILLICIQIHDVGNIFGRYRHELNSKSIIEEVENIICFDSTEIKVIYDIAKSHGGKTETGDKDKISKLNEIEKFLDNNVRARFISSILRFADELADDKRRSNLKLVFEDAFPKQSQVFHVYASCLDNVVIEHDSKSVELHYKIPADFVDKEFGKLESSILILDEIYNRVIKMHYERIYFMRFSSNYIDIRNITVFIDFYDKYISAFEPISFDIYEKGFPDSENTTIYDLCDKLVDSDGKRRDGNYIINKYLGENES